MYQRRLLILTNLLIIIVFFLVLTGVIKSVTIIVSMLLALYALLCVWCVLSKNI